MISTNTSDNSYVFKFSTNTSIHTFLFSLLSNSPFSLHHVWFAKTNPIITRTEPREGKLEYCCKSCMVMVCWRLHKKENLHFPWRLFFKTKRYYPMHVIFLLFVIVLVTIWYYYVIYGTVYARCPNSCIC